MADKKISQLPIATTPLAGTEVLPIVQSSTTDQVSVANLTAGRVPAMNNAAMGFTSTASAAGTTTLTATSNHVQKLTGSSTQTYKLPDATTMTAGTAFIFDNDSTGLLTVVDNASGAVTTVASGSAQYVYLMTNATAAGTWGKYSWVSGAGALAVTTAKSASITNSLTLSGTDSTTMIFPTTSATIARTDAGQTFTGNQQINGNVTTGSGSGVIVSKSGSAVTFDNAYNLKSGYGVGYLMSGNTSSNYTDFYMGFANMQINANSHIFKNQTDTTAYLTLSSTGNATLHTGNLVIGTNLKGISFEGGDGLISVNNSASNIYIGGGGTSPTGVYLQGTYAFVPGAYNDTTASAANLFVASNGELKRSTSALKYKQDVRDLEEIDTNLIRPVRYKSKCDNDDQTKDHFGVIADEVDAAGITELVIYGENGEVEGFDYGKLTVVLLKKIQSLEAKIKALESK